MMNANEKAIAKKNATDYILYMIAGSYFAKAVCTTKVIEKRLFLYYKELSVKDQEQIENTCIKYVETQLMNEVPQRIWDEEVKVSMKPDTAGRLIITFTGSHWDLKICSENLKGKTKRSESDEKSSKTSGKDTNVSSKIGVWHLRK